MITCSVMKDLIPRTKITWGTVHSSPVLASDDMSSNKYKLSRNIPQSVKTEVRRRCGFGCVLCGNAIITYEHIDPPFANARKHDPKCITLLCGDHQIQSSKGLLSKERIKKADGDPYCRQKGHAKHLFDLGGKKPILLVGGNNFTECGHKFQVDGQTLFEILAPDRKSSKWRLSAKFQDKSGMTICEILENELILNSTVFDIKQTATRFSIDSPDETILELEVKPPASLLLKTYRIFTKHGKITIGTSMEIDIIYKMDTGIDKFIERESLTFEGKNGEKVVFIASSFISPEGLNFRFCGGGLLL
jgi:hypothetical protein